MSEEEKVRFTSTYDLQAVSNRISESFREPRIRDMVIPTAVHLSGNVKSDSVLIWRHRGGRFSYAHFEGKLKESGSGSILEGRLVGHTPNFGHLIGIILIFFGIAAITIGILAWQGVKTIAVLAIGALLGVLGGGVTRFATANTKAEVDLLKREISALVERQGV